MGAGGVTAVAADDADRIINGGTSTGRGIDGTCTGKSIGGGTCAGGGIGSICAGGRIGGTSSGGDIIGGTCSGEGIDGSPVGAGVGIIGVWTSPGMGDWNLKVPGVSADRQSPFLLTNCITYYVCM